MRYLFFFLLISVNAFSQNYQYAMEEAKKASHQDITAPTIPANFVVRNISSTSATLNWTAADDNVEVMDYRIYNDNILLIPSTEGDVTNYKLSGLSPSTNYNLTLRAVDAAGNESKNSNNQVFTTNDKDPEITRFIIVGNSILYSAFHNTNSLKTTVENTYPNAKVFFYNHASPGETIGSYATGNIPNITHTLSLYNNDDPTIKTYVIVALGVNDRTRKGPYKNLSSAQIARMNDNLSFILDSIEGKGFIPILNDIGFINYDGIAYDDEEHGIKPYNEHIIKPKILERSAEFAFEDGQSFWQLYTLMYNNHESYASSDYIHPSSLGYSAMRTAFVNTICKYIFTGVAPTKIIKNNLTARPSSNNMYNEDDYLNAYYYPSTGSSAAGLQSALNTYGAVRLDTGSYGTNSQTITMGSNQRLYGVPWITKTPKIRILPGSSDVVIDGIIASGSIFLESGSVISNNVIKNTHSTRLKATGGQVQNNIIVNFTGGFDLDFSSSGYFRNNTIIKQWIHGSSPQIVLRGNTTTPSYGNIHIWVNNLTPGGDGNLFDTVQDHTIIGLDSEGWNLSGSSNQAMTVMRNMGDVKIADLGGGNGYSPVKTPPFDIEAKNLHLFNSNLNNSDANNNSKVRANTNVYLLNGKSRYDVLGNGFNLNIANASTALYNALALTSIVTDPVLLGNIKRSILGEQKTPIARPQLAAIPNPTGSNWANDRKGKTDQAAYIQNLINTNQIAELPEGIYYIGSTLKLKGKNEGIRGAGTGKTAIVGLTDDFPLITFSDINTSRRWHISNLTLQGGHTGLRVQASSDAQMMVTGVVMRDVIFRDQTYGIHLYRFFGLDNNFFENVNFITCDIGLFQDPNPSYSGGPTNSMMYMDKNVFYKIQVINCGIGFKMHAKRANNLNSWVDCVFDGNDIAVDLRGSNYSNFVNSDFKNHKGDYIIGQSTLSLYSCNFSNNTSRSIFRTGQLNMEGCVVSDNVPLLVKVSNNPTTVYIQNSTITGSLGHYTGGVISNSFLRSNPILNKLLVHIIDGKATTILSDPPNPYPQYLVRKQY